MTTIPGLHHVTAISGPPQANLDFYTGTLGQRLVKRTVNFDDPGTYHLYYADRDGSPGTVLTFFPFVDAGPGRAGPGMASAFAYAVPTIEPWMDRLASDAVDFEGPAERFGQRMVALADPDGLRVELVETGGPGSGDEGFHSVTLWVDDPEPTARMLTEIMGYEAGPQEGSRLRLAAPGEARGRFVDLIRSETPSIGRQGAGTIHHVAFRARSYEEQQEWRERVAAAGLDVTPVIDRQYFRAIYFREPGGVLFEIATDPPGFATDEPAETMGADLKLPERYEPIRGRIERTLPPLRLPEREEA
jgi:glyoxalase family protein